MRALRPANLESARQMSSNVVPRSAAGLLPFIVLPLALDFKGAEGGGFWQYLVTGVTFVAAAAYLLSNPSMPAKTRLWRLAVLALLAPVLGGLFTWLAFGTPLDRFVRVAIPSWLLLTGVLVAARICWKGGAQHLMGLLYLGCLASAVFTVFAGFIVTGASVSEVRFQILSPVLSSLQAILLHKILVRRSYKWSHVIWLVATATLQVLSTTRSAVLAFLILFAAAVWLGAPTFKAFARKTFSCLAVIVVTAFLLVQTASLFNPQIASRWEDRLSTTEDVGFDPTTLSRIAELKEQVKLWKEDGVSVLFGRGYGAGFGWAEEFFDDLLQSGQFDIGTLGAEYFEAGHNFWVYSLFAGGLFLGIWQPLLMGWLGIYSLWTTKKRRRRQWTNTEDADLSRLGALLILAFLVTTIGGNPMGPRYTPLITGLAIGMFLVQDCRRRQATSVREASRHAAMLAGAGRPLYRGQASISAVLLDRSHP